MEVKDHVPRDNFLQVNNMVVIGNLGSKVVGVVGHLESLEKVRGHLVVRDMVEETYKMCNILNVRRMVIINHTICLKEEMLMRELVL